MISMLVPVLLEIDTDDEAVAISAAREHIEYVTGRFTRFIEPRDGLVILSDAVPFCVVHAP